MKALLKVAFLAYCASITLTANAMFTESRCASQVFTSELDAVRAAADRYNPISIRENREYVGAIFESAGRFSYTVRAAASGSDSWQLEIPHKDWGRVRAFWHTHGDASPQNRYFSDADTASVFEHGIPFYLADYTGYLKVFRSTDRILSSFAARRLNLPRQRGFAIGEYVRDERRRPIRIRVRESSRV